MADPAKAVLNTEGGEPDTEDMEDVEDEEGKSGNVSNIKNPDMMSILQNKQSTITLSPQEYVESLPKCVKRRIKALKKLQLECTKLESKFYEEVHALECKYAELYSPYFEKRYQISSGKLEPGDEDCDFPSDVETDDEQIAEELKKKVHIEENKEGNEEPKNEHVKGVPEFWLVLFKNVDMLAEMIQKYDEPILEHLIDVRVKFSQSNPMGFTLEFHFEPNEYFTNTVLTKEYEMKCTPDENDPFSFDGPEIYKCKGCTIDWKKGKNVTVKTIKKKQKHKSRGSVRTITKTVQNDSFFNFFNPPALPQDDEQLDEDTQALLAADFEIGHFIRERIVPRAVLFFTGEALTDEYDEEDEEEEDEEDEGDDNDENDPEYNPQSGKGGRNNTSQQPAECKQQ